MRKRVALPAAIKAIREAKAVTDPRFRISAFAIECGKTPGHLCNIEAGRKPATQEFIHTLAGRLGVPVDAISYEVDVITGVAA